MQLFFIHFELKQHLAKGQLLSKCLFEKIVSTKIPTKNLIDSAQKSLYRQGKYLCWPESYIIYEVLPVTNLEYLKVN